MFFKKKVLFILLLVLVSGCGFSYKTKDLEVINDSVFVQLIPEKDGIFMRNELMKTFPSKSPVSSGYDILVELDIDITAGVTSSSFAQSKNVFVDVTWYILEAGQVIERDEFGNYEDFDYLFTYNFTVKSSYPVSTNPLLDKQSEEKAVRSLLLHSSQRIVKSFYSVIGKMQTDNEN